MFWKRVGWFGLLVAAVAICVLAAIPDVPDARPAGPELAPTPDVVSVAFRPTPTRTTSDGRASPAQTRTRHDFATLDHDCGFRTAVECSGSACAVFVETPIDTYGELEWALNNPSVIRSAVLPAIAGLPPETVPCIAHWRRMEEGLKGRLLDSAPAETRLGHRAYCGVAWDDVEHVTTLQRSAAMAAALAFCDDLQAGAPFSDFAELMPAVLALRDLSEGSVVASRAVKRVDRVKAMVGEGWGVEQVVGEEVRVPIAAGELAFRSRLASW